MSDNNELIERARNEAWQQLSGCKTRNDMTNHEINILIWTRLFNGCDHDFSVTEVADGHELVKCVHCSAYVEGVWDEMPGFCNDSSQIVRLTDAILAHDEDNHIVISCHKRSWVVEIYQLGETVGSNINRDDDHTLPEALAYAVADYLERLKQV